MESEPPREGEGPSPPILEPMEEETVGDTQQINLLAQEAKQGLHTFEAYSGGSDEPEVSHIAEEVQISSSEEPQSLSISREVSRLFGPAQTTPSSLRLSSYKKPTPEPTEKRTRSWSAIPDERYEKLIKCLQEGTMVQPSDQDYKPIHRLLLMKRLKVKTVWDVVFNKEMIRIVDKNDEKIIPRRSEVMEILKYYFIANGQPGPRALCNFANRTYCGIGKHQADEFEFSIDKANRRHGITFKKELRNIPERPMQHIQIDLTDMTTVSRGQGSYSHLLTIQCIFSRFFLAEPLETREQDLVTHFLMKFFTMFGPPEAYQTYTGHKVIDEAMQDIAAQFRVAIHCYGRNGLNTQVCNDHYSLRRKILERSAALFGPAEDMQQHWPECIEATLMERNMRIHPTLKTLTPFEVMFGRQPCQTTEPPWLDPDATEAELHAPVPIDQTLDDAGYFDRASKMRGMASHALRQQKARTVVRNLEYASLGPESDNSFSLQFLPGDEVYVRNPEFGGTGPKRFLRGVVQEVFPDQEWPYKVQLYAGEIDDELAGSELFVSPVDITATTKNLEKLRTQDRDASGRATGKRKEVCQCPDNNCRLPASPACPYGYHRNCCRQIGLPAVCKLHHKAKDSSPPPSTSRRKRRSQGPRQLSTSNVKSVKTAPANRDHLEPKETEANEKKKSNEEKKPESIPKHKTELVSEDTIAPIECELQERTDQLTNQSDAQAAETTTKETTVTQEDPINGEPEITELPSPKKKKAAEPRAPRRSNRVKEPPKKLYEDEVRKEEEKRQRRAEEKKKERLRQQQQQLGIGPYDPRYRIAGGYRGGTLREDRFGNFASVRRRTPSFNRSDYIEDYDDYYDYDSEEGEMGARSVVIQQPRGRTKQVNLTVYPPGRSAVLRQNTPSTVKVLVSSGDGKMEEAEVSPEVLQRYKASGRLSTVVVNRGSGEMMMQMPKQPGEMRLRDTRMSIDGDGFLDLNAEGDLLTTSETPPIDKNVIVD